MLIYNGERYESTYFDKDPFKIKIKCKLPFEEFLEKMRAGEKISCYMKVERDCAIKFKNNYLSIDNFLNELFYDDDFFQKNLDTVSLLNKANHNSSDLLKIYCYFIYYKNILKDALSNNDKYGYPKNPEDIEQLKEIYFQLSEFMLEHNLELKEIYELDSMDYLIERRNFFVKPDELLEILADYYGLLPEAIHCKEFTIKQLEDMSDAVYHYWHFDRGKESPYQPSFEFAQVYSQISPEERNLFDRSGIEDLIKQDILILLNKNGEHYTADLEAFLHKVNVRAPGSPYTPLPKEQIKLYKEISSRNGELNEYVLSTITDAFSEIEHSNSDELKKIKEDCLFALLERIDSPNTLQYVINKIFDTYQVDKIPKYCYTEEYYKLLRKNMNRNYKKEEEINLDNYFKDKDISTLTFMKPKFLERTKEAFVKRHRFIPKIINTISNISKSYCYDPNSVAAAFERKNIGLVAKYNNPALIALGIEGFDFRNVPEKTIELINLFVTPYNTKSLIALNEWFKSESKKCTNEDLANIISNCNSIPVINNSNKPIDVEQLSKLGITTKTMKIYASNVSASYDIKQYEHLYDYNFRDNKVEIRGAKTGVKNKKYKAYILHPYDTRNFTVGYDTHCCQHYGNAGENCVYLATSHPDSGIFVIEDTNGKILAQAFVWVDKEKDTFVFDNIEFADFRSMDNVQDILYDFCAQLPYKNIHMGMGYNEMNEIGEKIKTKELAEMPKSDTAIYSDYSTDAVKLKQNGKMLFTKQMQEKSDNFTVDEVSFYNDSFTIKETPFYESLSASEKIFINKAIDKGILFTDDKFLLKLIEMKKNDFSIKNDFIEFLTKNKTKSFDNLMEIYFNSPYLANIMTQTQYMPNFTICETNLNFLDDIASHINKPNQFSFIYDELIRISNAALMGEFKDTSIQDEIDKIIKNIKPQQIREDKLLLTKQIQKLLFTESVLKNIKLNMYYNATNQLDRQKDTIEYIKENSEKILSDKKITNNTREKLIKEFHKYKKEIPISINKLAFICDKEKINVNDFIKLIDFNNLNLIDKYNNEQMLRLMLSGFDFTKIHPELINIIDSTISEENINYFLIYQNKFSNIEHSEKINFDDNLTTLINLLKSENQNQSPIQNRMQVEEII